MPRRGNSNNNETVAEETQDEVEVVETESSAEGRFEESQTDEVIVDERESSGKTGDGFPRSMDDYKGDKISVETTGDFQLYDATTMTLFPHEGSVEVPENSQFVLRNIANGKLKKV